MLIVQASQSLTDGDGHYRLHAPLSALGALPDVFAIDCDIHHRHFWRLAESCDVLIVHFFSNWLLYSLFEARRKKGKITVFETNDYFADLQAWNPIFDAWLDPDLRNQHTEYVRAADLVQTSTPRLAHHYAGVARNSVVFENHLVEVPALAPAQSGKLTIGWGGSKGHLADWYETTRSLQGWLQDRPEINVAVMTNHNGQHFLQLPEQRYYFQVSRSLMEYYSFLNRLDIGLAPLLPTEYNRCRSDVKFLEYASHGVVGIYANLEPYRDTVEHGKTGFLYSSEAEMYECLELLIRDENLRNEVRQRAYEYVSKHRRLADHIQERAVRYRETLARPTEASTVPEEILKCGHREGNYLRLELDQVSQAYFQIVQQKASPQGVQLLGQIVQQTPRYLLALQTLTRMLNDLRMADKALPFAEQARMMLPSEPTSLLELARTYFLSGDDVKARQYLEQALQANPSFIPVWESLLRLAKLKSHPDLLDLAQRAREQHPYSWQLALSLCGVYEGDQLREYLCSFLEHFSSQLNSEQREKAAKLFVPKICAATQNELSQESALSLLELSWTLFPYSKAIAIHLGAALRQHGRHTESDQVLCKALDLHRVESHVRNENEVPTEIHVIPQLVEHIFRLPGHGLDLKSISHQMKGTDVKECDEPSPAGKINPRRER